MVCIGNRSNTPSPHQLNNTFIGKSSLFENLTSKNKKKMHLFLKNNKQVFICSTCLERLEKLSRIKAFTWFDTKWGSGCDWLWHLRNVFSLLLWSSIDSCFYLPYSMGIRLMHSNIAWGKRKICLIYNCAWVPKGTFF